MTADEWERGADDLDALIKMIEEGEPVIDGAWTCGTASLKIEGWVHIEVGVQKRQKAWPRGMHQRPDMLKAWCCLALAAEARLCRAKAVLARTFDELIEEEASK